MDTMAWWNGEIVETGEVRVSATDYGFLYGYGLFETVRAYQGKPYLLIEHLARLKHGADVLGIRVDTPLIAQAVTSVIVANNITEGRIRVTVSPGEGSLRPDIESCVEPTVLVMAIRYKPPPEDVYRRGYHVVISDIVRNSRSPMNQYKSADYLDCIYALQTARKAGYDEALMLNDRGKLAECATGNLFLVKRGKLLVPDENSGILPGITRQQVILIAEELGITVKTGTVSTGTLNAADEAFLTNSLMEIMPLTAVNGKQVGTGKQGEITARLHAVYREKVAATLMLLK
jgi:branched-chain amino acid aminotransferase